MSQKSVFTRSSIEDRRTAYFLHSLFRRAFGAGWIDDLEQYEHMFDIAFPLNEDDALELIYQACLLMWWKNRLIKLTPDSIHAHIEQNLSWSDLVLRNTIKMQELIAAQLIYDQTNDRFEQRNILTWLGVKVGVRTNPQIRDRANNHANQLYLVWIGMATQPGDVRFYFVDDVEPFVGCKIASDVRVTPSSAMVSISTVQAATEG
jgi:hypothetical protein